MQGGERQQLRAGRAGQLGGEAEAHAALLAVEDDDAVGHAASSAAAARAASRPPSPLARPSVTASTSARRSGSRRRSRRDELGRAVQPGGQRRRAAGGQRAEHGGGALDAAGGREHDLRAGAAEGDERDAVAPAVGVEEQAEDRALDRGHAPARAHRPAGVDAEDDEVALAPGADVLAQVGARERRPVGQRAAARGGAQAGGDGEVGHRSGRRAAVDGLALGAGGAAAPPGGSVADAGEAERRARAGGAGRVDALGSRRVGVGRGVGGGAQAARLAAARGGGSGRGALGRAVAAEPFPLPSPPAAPGRVGVVAAGLVHRLLELCVVEARRLQRPAPAAMGERQARRAAHVVLAHGVVAVEGGQRAGGLRAHDVGAHAVDAQARADAGDEQQRALVEHDARQALAGGRRRARERRLVGGEARAHRVGVGVEGQPPAHDLDALRRIGAGGDVDAEPEAVEQLRAQLALLGVHGPHEQEARRVRRR